MTTPTNWPNPERPGWPLNPERDGLYALRVGGNVIVRHWSATRQHYSSVPGWKLGISPSEAEIFDFEGEILTPTQLTDLLAGERERCATIAEREFLGSTYPDEQEVYARGRSDAARDIRYLGDAP